MGKKLVTDVYVDGVVHSAGDEAPDGVENPAAFDLDEWRKDSLAVRAKPDDKDEPAVEPDDEPAPKATRGSAKG